MNNKKFSNKPHSLLLLNMLAGMHYAIFFIFLLVKQNIYLWNFIRKYSEKFICDMLSEFKYWMLQNVQDIHGNLPDGNYWRVFWFAWYSIFNLFFTNRLFSYLFIHSLYVTIWKKGRPDYIDWIFKVVHKLFSLYSTIILIVLVLCS